MTGEEKQSNAPGFNWLAHGRMADLLRHRPDVDRTAADALCALASFLGAADKRERGELPAWSRPRVWVSTAAIADRAKLAVRERKRDGRVERESEAVRRALARAEQLGDLVERVRNVKVPGDGARGFTVEWRVAALEPFPHSGQGKAFTPTQDGGSTPTQDRGSHPHSGQGDQSHLSDLKGAEDDDDAADAAALPGGRAAAAAQSRSACAADTLAVVRDKVAAAGLDVSPDELAASLAARAKYAGGADRYVLTSIDDEIERLKARARAASRPSAKKTNPRTATAKKGKKPPKGQPTEAQKAATLRRRNMRPAKDFKAEQIQQIADQVAHLRGDGWTKADAIAHVAEEWQTSKSNVDMWEHHGREAAEHGRTIAEHREARQARWAQQQAEAKAQREREQAEAEAQAAEEAARAEAKAKAFADAVEALKGGTQLEDLVREFGDEIGRRAWLAVPAKTKTPDGRVIHLRRPPASHLPHDWNTKPPAPAIGDVW